MHPPEVRAAALALVEQGLNDCQISRRLGIPRGTIRDWRRPTYVPREVTERCPRCWHPAKPIRFTPGHYSELLAMYLGDGSISQHRRTQRLRVVLDKGYPGIIKDARALLEQCFPANKVDAVDAPGCVHLSVYSRHLACVFPQHGPGPKHKRRIQLEPWQQQIVEAAPWSFIRGCINTDGSSFINRTGPYGYLSYDFCNMSGDTIELFVRACDRVEVVTRTTGGSGRIWRVRINRRESVGLMRDHIGLKT